MGLFSKIKKAVKKVGSGLKKAVKKVASGIKKVAKKVAYAIPGGEKLWKAGTKLAQKAKKGAMKVMSKLGPVGIIAIQAVLSATGVGTGIAVGLGKMWSVMGSAAYTAATTASGVMGALGSVANAVFTGVNWAGSAIGAVGEALAAGGEHLATQGFSGAASTFGKTLTNSLTGNLQSIATKQAVAGAASKAGVGMFEQALNAGSNALATSGGTLASLGSTTAEQAAKAASDKVAMAAADASWGTPIVQESIQDVAAKGVTAEIGAFAPSSNLGATIAKEAAWYDPLVSKGTEILKDTTTDYVQKEARSLLSPSGTTATQPASGYQPITSNYEDYIAAQGGAFAAPVYGQAVTASKVGGG